MPLNLSMKISIICHDLGCHLLGGIILAKCVIKGNYKIMTAINNSRWTRSAEKNIYVYSFLLLNENTMEI